MLDSRQKAALRRDGFVVVPRAVPRSRVDAALREINRALGARPDQLRDPVYEPDYRCWHSSAPALVSLYTETAVSRLVDQLLAPGPLEKVEQAQVALRFPTPPGIGRGHHPMHVDGLGETQHELSRFTLCAGVILSDVPRPRMGNLLVYPGSHKTLADAVKARGLASLEPGGVRGLLGDEREPVEITGRAGDVVLLHHQTAHDKAFNDSPGIRYMAYFRVYHSDCWKDRSRAAIERALGELWAEWPSMRSRRAAA